MQFNDNIQIKEPDTDSLPFRPILQFRFEQLNLSAECMNEDEIDGQVNQLINRVEQLRKDAKKKFKNSIKKHDDLFKNKVK